jgi:serine/threonine protein kinase
MQSREIINERYTKLDVIGKGSYGIVYKSCRLTDNQSVAIKHLLHPFNEDGVEAETIREMAILNDFMERPHPNITSVSEIIMTDARKIYIVMELADQTLEQYIDTVYMTEAQVMRIINDILLGVDALHLRGILHRDIKPQNILVFKSGAEVVCKLADFDAACRYSLNGKRISTNVGTMWYRAPELLLGMDTYTTSPDVWAVGCIMYELLARGRPIFPGDSETDMLLRMFRQMGTPTEETWPGVTQLPDWRVSLPQWPGMSLSRQIKIKSDTSLDLLKSLLIMCPARRISTRTALAHAWFGAENHDTSAKTSSCVDDFQCHDQIGAKQ